MFHIEFQELPSIILNAGISNILHMPPQRSELQHTLVSKHFNLYYVLEIKHIPTRVLVLLFNFDRFLFLEE